MYLPWLSVAPLCLSSAGAGQAGAIDGQLPAKAQAARYKLQSTSASSRTRPIQIGVIAAAITTSAGWTTKKTMSCPKIKSRSVPPPTAVRAAIKVKQTRASCAWLATKIIQTVIEPLSAVPSSALSHRPRR